VSFAGSQVLLAGIGPCGVTAEQVPVS